MSNITTESVRQLAILSALDLDDSELSLLTKDIDNILSYVEELGELDTEGVEPTYQVTSLNNVFREDVVEDSPVSRQQLLDLAPEQKSGQIKVPKVL